MKTPKDNDEPLGMGGESSPQPLNDELAIADIIHTVQFNYYQRGKETDWAVGVDKEASEKIRKYTANQIKKVLDDLNFYRERWPWKADPRIKGLTMREWIPAERLDEAIQEARTRSEK